MGIKRFYGGFLRSPKFKAVRTNRIPKNIDGVYIDMNGGIHKVAQKTYAYGDRSTEKEKDEVKDLLENNPEELDNKFFADLTTYLADVLLTLKPGKRFVICVDGVALLAKVTQQRSRRFKAALENRGKDTTFDSSAITPGTDFMIKLDLFFQSWIREKRDVLPETVIYSSHLEKGEGEHKIFEMIREGIIEEGTGFHAVIGMDADLTILSSLCHFENIVLIREDWNDVLNISAFRDELVEKMSVLSPNKEDKKLIMQDFALITFLIGNDFIPHNMSLDDVGESLFIMLSLYSNLGYRMTGEDGSINWLAFFNFLTEIVKLEPELIKGKSEKEMKYPSTLLESVYGNNKVEKEDKFNLFREKWYEHVLNPRLTFPSSITFVTDESINDMCESYVFGLQWNLKYYLDHSVTNTYVYKYLYAPLLSDVRNYLHEKIEKDRKGLLTVKDVDRSDKDISNYGPIHQLVSVISPLSADVIPKKYRHLILPGGELAHMCPLNFELELEGVNKEFEALAILPPLDVQLIVSAVGGLIGDRIPDKYREAKRWISVVPRKTVERSRAYIPRPTYAKPLTEGEIENVERGPNQGRGYAPDAGRGQNQGRGYVPNAGRGQNQGRGYVQNSGRGYVPEAVRNYAQNTGRGYVPDTGRGYGQNTGRGYVQNAGRSYAQNAGRGYVQNTGRGYVQNTGRGYAQNTEPVQSVYRDNAGRTSNVSGLSLYSVLGGASEFTVGGPKEYRKAGGVNVLEF
jgi:5'-3' exonuclease